MRQTIRTTLLLSSAALFATACTNMPTEGQNTAYNTGGYNTAPASTGNVPEAGPLTADNTPAAATYNTTMAANVPVAAPQNIPVATVPQVPAANYNPAATAGNDSPYDTYAANAAAPDDYSDNTMVDYSQPQSNSNDSYTSYGTGNTTAAANPVTTYYPDNNASYDSYANNGNNGGYSNAAVSGGSAVQVFASGSQAKAEQISQNMRSQGLPAVVDMVNGLYKVRIPYPDEGAARANLIRVRQASGEAGAFVTHR